MPLLKEIQLALIRTLRDGPDALDPELFAGPVDRIMLGLQLHALTIHKARLTALECCFPQTRTAMGETAFRSVCDSYVETVAGRASVLNAISADFPDFLRTHCSDQDFATLAIEELRQLQL